MVDQHRRALARQWRMFAHSFRLGGAPLYHSLSIEAARAMSEDEPFCAALGPWLGEPERLLLPLRLLAAVHRWVLDDRLPDLAAYYPSAGGSLPAYGEVWPLFRDAVVRHADELRDELAGVNQHNEVGRAAALSIGFLEAARRYRYGLPLLLLEVGASAGLLLTWDHYISQPWYPGMFEVPMQAPLDQQLPLIIQRQGCDLNPIDPTTPEGGRRLLSWVWADLVEHVRMLEVAMGIGRRVPAVVERAEGVTWLARELAEPMPGVLTVVYHAMVAAAAGPEDMAVMRRTIVRAGSRTTHDAPLAYLRFEMAEDRANQPAPIDVALTTWPDGHDRVVATCDVNGRHIRLVHQEGASQR